MTKEELAEAYREHAEDWEKDADKAFWDKVALDDGLEDLWLADKEGSDWGSRNDV